MKTILRWTLLITGVCILPARAANQILLRNPDPGDGIPQILATDHSGHVFVISTLASGQPAIRAVKLDLNGSRLASLDIPRIVYPRAAVADAQGNLVVTGQDLSFSEGIILKLDPQLHSTLFSRSLPGTIGAVAVDESGNILVTGSTDSVNFPLTADAYQTKPPGPGNSGIGRAAYAFLTKVSPGGDQLLYSTYFGGDATNCPGGSACIGTAGSTGGTAIAVDKSGAVVIAGDTSASDLPVTPGVLGPTCPVCGYRYSHSEGFIARFRPGVAKQLEWSTYLTGNLSILYGSAAVYSLDLDAAANVIVAGGAPPGLPTTPGTIQPSVVPVPLAGSDRSGFVMKLNSSATAVVWGTYFGGTDLESSAVKAVRLDPQGRVVFTGAATWPSQQVYPNFRWSRYVARLSDDGASLVDYYEGPVGDGLVITSTGGFAALGEALWIETARPGPSLLAVANSASGAYARTLAPVELITFYGAEIGPETPVNGQVQNGAFTASLGGCQVLFDGVPAPLLYAASGQINAVVPRQIGPAPHIRVVTPSGDIDGPNVPRTYQPVPGVFKDSTTGFAAALNQDGSINSLVNPAKAGTTVAVFATGVGANYFPDGTLVPMGIYNALTSVWAGGQRSFEVEFAGDAPGLVAGIMQVNFRLPELLPSGKTLTFSLIIGGVSTGQSQINVTQ